jgi:predicted regulator of Ras-like GTPase activity (Roadblock/LC7/MglB family)
MFQTILAKLVSRADARWAMIVGSDGVLLETDKREFHSDAEGMAAEYATYVRASQKAAGDTDMGGLVSSMLVAEQGKLLIQALTADYFLVLCLEPEAHAGKAFFEISRTTESIAEELVF